MERVHYPFDEEFIQVYHWLLVMLRYREYNLEGLAGVEGGEVVALHNVRDTTSKLVTAFRGLEKFSLNVRHTRDPRLNLLVFYLIPKVESKSPSQEKKQISTEQVRAALSRFEQSEEHQRLILLSKNRLAPAAVDRINEANAAVSNMKPLKLVQHILTSFLKFDRMDSIYQPRDVRVLRGQDLEERLDMIHADASIEDKRSILPQRDEKDPLVVYIGAKLGDVIFLRQRVNASRYVPVLVLVVRQPSSA